MQKNLIFLFFITILVITGAAAQAIDTNCITYARPVFYYAEKGAHFTGSLDKYFKKDLPDHGKSQGGAFKIKLIIDSVGRLDCLTIENNTTSYTPEEIRTCINNMPEWLPAMQNGHPVTFSAIIEVAVNNNQLTVAYLNERPRKPN